MATFEIQSPDGRKFRVTAPDGARPEDVLTYAQQNAPKAETRPEATKSSELPLPPQAAGAPHLLMGARQVWDAAAQLAASGVEGIADKFGGSKTLTGMREDTERTNKEAFEQYKARFDPNGGAVPALARGVGQALVTAPITPAIKAAGAIKGLLGGAGIGAGAAALTPVYDAPEGKFWSEKGKQASIGGITGGALGGVFGLIGKAAPTTAAKELLSAGVRVPTGRAAGGAIGRLEEGAESIPIAGDVIRGAHRRAVEDFNRASTQQALDHIGETVSPSAVGRSLVKEARVKISNAYNKTLDKIGRVDLDKQFSDDGAKLYEMTAELGEGTQKQFQAILKNRVYDRITPAGTVSATTMKEVDSELGRQAWGFMKSPDPNQRGLGEALLEVQASLRRNVERSAGPELAQEVANANAAWAKWLRVADASTRAGSKEGVFSPAALRAASQKADKRGFRDGDALMQDWAQKAEAVLGPKVPDSGSPYRLLGAASLGGLLDPAIATTGAGIAAAYTAPGQRALSALAGKADNAAAIAPYLGLLSPSLLQAR